MWVGVGTLQPRPEGFGIAAVLAGAPAVVERGVAAVRAVPVMIRVRLSAADGANLVVTLAEVIIQIQPVGIACAVHIVEIGMLHQVVAAHALEGLGLIATGART